ncbi:MAG: peptidoglycan editing factor PgeF [Dethiobacteria bacterium]
MLSAGGIVDHAFSTRLGGCSTGSVASLNMAFHTDDQEENVLENRCRFFKIFNCDHLEIVSAAQVHGSEIARVDQNNRSEGATPGSTTIRCDALLTTEPELVLTAYSADCMLIYIAVTDIPLIAIVHAGRRGTLQGIAEKVIRVVTADYRVSPDRIMAVLSPSICKNCYTIKQEIAAEFSSAGWTGREYLEQGDSPDWHLDLAAINRAQLLNAGLSSENLDQSELCTSCRSDLFYSYRRDRGKTGRMIGFIKLRSNRGENKLER